MKKHQIHRIAIVSLSLVMSFAAFTVSASASRLSNHAKASHTPILIGTEAPLTSPYFSLPENINGMDAAISVINSGGGVNGHPLKLVSCDTLLTANGELSCAHELIADHVVAVIDSTIVIDQSGEEFHLFARAGIPYFAGPGTSAAELTSTNSFPLSSGSVGWFYGPVRALIDGGATKFTIMAGVDASVEEYSANFILAAFKAYGVSSSNVSVVYCDPTSDPTLAACAAKAIAGGVNGIFMVPNNPVLMVTALNTAGYTGKMAGVSSTTEAVLPYLGSAANGNLVASQTAFATDTSNPAVRSFRANMTKYQPKGKIDGNSLSAYASILLFADVAKTSTAKTLTAKTFKKAAESIRKPINIGLIGPWATLGVKPVLPQYPRILSPYVQLATVVNGAFQANGQGFINPVPKQ